MRSDYDLHHDKLHSINKLTTLLYFLKVISYDCWWYELTVATLDTYIMRIDND